MWKTISHEQRGRSHIKNHTPCQDKTFVHRENGVCVIALADGAGSASYSEYGAEIVTKSICSYVGKHFNDMFESDQLYPIKQDIIHYLLEQLHLKSEEIECSIHELASTLLVAAVHQDRYLLMHLGDGVVGYVKNEELKVASKPENGEYTNSTLFVTSKNAIHHLKMFKGYLNGISSFILMSDGTAESFYHKSSHTLSPVLNKVIQYVLMLKQDHVQNLIKDSFEQVITQKTTDDCSIAIMTLEPNENVYFDLSFSEKCTLLNLHDKNPRRLKKQIKVRDQLMQSLKVPKAIHQLEKELYTCQKRINHYLKELQCCGLVEKCNQLYRVVNTK